MLDLHQAHPEITPFIASNLNFDEVKELRQCNTVFKTQHASFFTKLAVVNSPKIADMAALLVDANNVCRIRIINTLYFGDKELAQLIELLPENGAQVVELDLTACRQITDAGIAHLRNLTALRSLNLDNCSQITNVGLAHLSHKTAMRSLNLRDCRRITNAGLAPLAGMTRMQSLNLQECDQITDAGLDFVEEMPVLQSLLLYGCRQTSAARHAQIENFTKTNRRNLEG